MKYVRGHHRDAATAPDRCRSSEPAYADDAPTRERVARSILENGPSTAAALADRLVLTPAAVRRHLDHLVAEGALEAREPRVYGIARPRTPGQGLRAHRVRPRHVHPGLRRPRRQRAALPPRVRRARTRSPSSPADAPPSSRSRYRAAARGRRPRGPRRGAGRGAERGRLRCLGAQRARRRPALPAPLPGRARRGRVPAAVRGRDRGLRPAARPPRPAAGHHRPRRRCLHHQHPRHRPAATRLRPLAPAQPAPTASTGRTPS